MFVIFIRAVLILAIFTDLTLFGMIIVDCKDCGEIGMIIVKIVFFILTIMISFLIIKLRLMYQEEKERERLILAQAPENDQLM